MFPVIEYIKTCLNGLRSRIEKVEKSISQALASVKEGIIQDIKNVRKESAEAIKSSTADWGQNDSNALDYVKNRTHYMLPATPIGSLEFTATSSGTIEYTMTISEEEYAMFQYFQSLRDKGEVLKVTVGGKTGLLAVTFDRGNFGFSGVFTGSVHWSAGNVLSLVAQNDFITFNQGDTYTVSFEDTTKPYYIKLDFNYIPDNVYHSENAPVKFGAGENSSVQGNRTTATGSNAHAEGNFSAATGPEAHAEGIFTKADGNGSHAEGSNTKATGDYSHAEGYNTEASGTNSHAEGSATVANRLGMHAEGKYNLYDSEKYVDVVTSSRENFWNNMYAASEYTFDADTGYYTLVNAEPKNKAVIGLYYASKYQYENGSITILDKPISLISGNNYNIERHNSNLSVNVQGKYVHVVGNGDSSARSNAHTLDWDGNGWFAGDVFVGGTGQDEGVKLLKAGEAIPIPQTASAGQTIVVKAVDENGKPTEWEPVTLPDKLPNPNALTFTGAATGSYDGSAPLSVEIPGGGSGNNDWELLADVTLTEDVATIAITQTPSGEAFSVRELVIIGTPISDGTNKTVRFAPYATEIKYGVELMSLGEVLSSTDGGKSYLSAFIQVLPEVVYLRTQYNQYDNNDVGYANKLNASRLRNEAQTGYAKNGDPITKFAIGVWSGGTAGVFRAGTKMRVYGR